MSDDTAPRRRSRGSVASHRPDGAPRRDAARPLPAPTGLPSFLPALLPAPLRALRAEIDERLAMLPTRVNEYGVDPFGMSPSYTEPYLLWATLVYRYWLRVETRGIERVPEGRVLLIGNHAGNTFAWDGAMLGMAMFLEASPPRIVRGMAEYFLPTIPWFNVMMHRSGSVVGTPENCVQLLEQGEAIMVFPEGERGFVKPFSKRYQLQRFGLGFLRLALETDTPIVPVGIVGAEEQSPCFANIRWIGRLFGSPAFPLTLTFPWLGLGSFAPLPVKFHIRFGEPMRFAGDANDDDAHVEKQVEVVKKAIRGLIKEGLAARKGWFT
ncbi:MAG TPA: lysophospholipid acyltransferase family protein [Myxococcota bacterium]|nr:lysophospholipid acyltransferase family protein [Myxococcota bacterium]